MGSPPVFGVASAGFTIVFSLGVVKHRAPLARGGPSSCQMFFLHVCPNIA
jgi:hypothetical protein